MNVSAVKPYVITEAVAQDRYPDLGKRLDLVLATSAREALVGYGEHHDPRVELEAVFEYDERLAGATLAEDHSTVVAHEWIGEHDGRDVDLRPRDAHYARSAPDSDARPLAIANAARVRELPEDLVAIARGWTLWKRRRMSALGEAVRGLRPPGRGRERFDDEMLRAYIEAEAERESTTRC